jgi:Carboxypeptidase regulatory-like domain/TonB dependent receptor
MKQLSRYVLVTFLLFSPCFLCAQIDRGELNGTVTDPNGGPLSGITVTITQEGTNQVRTVTTDGRGQFVVSSLPIGRFSILFVHNGFNDLRIADVDLHSGDVRTVNAKLAVGSVNQNVSVEADLEGAQLDKSDATFGGTVQSVQVQELPLNGRNIATLELLAPGAIDNGTGQQASIRFAGQGIDDSNYRLDGVDASGIYRMALKSGLRLQYSTEAVAEFKVDAGTYTADTGGSAGGQVSLISKSGTNAFHGSAFDYLRNSYFDALSPIKASVHPQFHLNQFGANVGGPIVRNRTFFFANYEGFRQQLGGVPQIGFVPSPAFRAQVVAAQQALAPIVNAFPQGQSPSPTDPNAYTFTGLVPSPDNENSGIVRVDHRFTDRNSGYVRYNIDDGTSTSALNALAEAITINSRVQNFVLEESHIFSPDLLNEAEFGFNRNTFLQSQQTGEPFNFSISGFTTIDENYSKAQIAESFSVNDTVTWTKGAHTIKTGVDVRFPQYNEANSIDGTASFLSEAAFFANQLDTFQTTAVLPDKGLRKEQIAGYLQDEWRTGQNLTLNYGVRYNFFSPFHEAHNSEDPFDIASCGGYCGIGAQFYFDNYLDFDPRLGFAYAPQALHGNTVLRAGFGIFHGEDQLGDEDSPVVNTEPSVILTSGKQSNGSTVQYSYPVPSSLTPSTGLALTPRSMARHHPDSYTEEWSGSIQQALPGQTVLTLTYLGAKGTHLFRRSYTNLIDPATGTRPFPEYPSEIDTKYNEGRSIFHAVQVNVNRRFHGGLFFAANYMLSHAIDDGSVGAGEADSAENVNCFNCEYSSSDDDVRNTGNVSAVYDLPFGRGRKYLATGRAADLLAGGWSVNTLFAARAGLPINVTLSRSASSLPDGNNVNQRPNRVSGVPIYMPHRNINTWLNPAAFSVPATGAWGTAGKNIANGPPLWQDDSTIEKTFHITERNHLIFRAEAFNIFNRAQYGLPGSGLNVGPSGQIVPTGGFGKITSTVNPTGLVGTGTPRELEFALRFTY